MMSHKICLTLLLFAPSLGATQPQDGAQSREQSSLIEEQELLTRKLVRIIGSMERLALQFEKEGRVHAAKLLRDGLGHVAARETESEQLPLEERMSSTVQRLQGGQSMQSIESQQAIIQELESLVSILMDRPDLDQLEDELAKIEQQKRELQGLASAEEKLREKTEQLKQDSSNETQQSLEESIQQSREQQRELLLQNEVHSREVGALDLERLEAQLENLLRDQQTDAAVASDWDPTQAPRLEQLAKLFEQASLDHAQSDRLEEAAQTLREGANADPSERARLLEDAAQAAQRAARASGDASAEEVAKSLKAASELANDSGTDPDEESAQLKAIAEQLEAKAAEESKRASDQVAAGKRALEQLQQEAQGSTAELARQLQQSLESSPTDAEAARRSASDTAQALRDAQDRSKFMGQALKSNQEANATRTESLQEALQRLPQDLGEAGEKAQQALSKAADAMRDAASNAEQDQAAATSDAASRASQSLQQAQEALSKAREARASDSGSSQAQRNQEMAAAQKDLAQKVQELTEQLSEASLGAESQADVQQALEQAAESMQEASQQMQKGQNSSAARSQREASEALTKAANEASEGVQPQTEEQQERAEELAREQEQIAQELFEFKQEQKEQRGEDGPKLDSLAKAEESAKAAAIDLDGGKLDEAQEQEEQAQKAIEEALDELEEKEEQYQKLRNEELLFKIAEEVTAILEPHLVAIEDTLEVNRGRERGSRVSRGHKLRLRKIARNEAALATRAAELTSAIRDEGSLVFAALLERIQKDLERIATQMGDTGGYQSGDRVQALQDDVTRDLNWLAKALEEEQDRREEEEDEEKGPEGSPGEPPPEGENRLVPDVAELKLLSQMDLDVLDQIEELLVLYPELKASAEVDPLLLEEIQRLAHRHERTSGLFKQFRERLGIAGPTAPTTKTEGTPETEE